MYISRFQLGNYKSFYEPPPLVFVRGFNIISGQNNSGKTALLETLGLNFVGHPHRSTKTVPARDTIPNQISWADISFTVSPRELKELMLATGSQRYRIIKPPLGSPFARNIGFVDDSEGSAQRWLTAFFSQESLTFKLRLQARAGQGLSWGLVGSPSYGLYPEQNVQGQWGYVDLAIDSSREVVLAGAGTTLERTDIGLQLSSTLQRHVYRFAAERMKVGRGPHGGNAFLAQNASNLPEVLSQLQHNTTRFRDLNRRLNAILPQVIQVSVRGIDPGQVEIVVWCHDPESQREDLAVPLSESGTGIGQVLAILYVVMISNRPQTIIIDEPQSFLHPGAVRKLVEFLKLYPQHQFIIATHSATIIAAANPKTITLARFEEGESTLEQLDTDAEKGIQATLAELGVRLSDLFGADNILWVEGRTEEKCFPLIVENIVGRPLMGTEILGIRQTGDLESRDAKKVFEIYRNLSRGASLLPPAIAFILDEECREEAAKHELCTLSGNRAEFLPGRMYENYLLNPRGIAEVANAIEGFRTPPLTPEEVGTAIDSRLNDPGYFCASEKLGGPTDRIRRIDGARVLKEIFNEFSDARVTYEKVRHGVALTEWLIKNAPEDLREIRDLLAKVLDRRGTSNTWPADGPQDMERQPPTRRDSSG